MTDTQLIIGNKNYSSWSLRPWLLMKHLNIPFEEIRIPLYTNNYSQKILQYSGAGKVPVLKINGLTIWDTLAISEYLAELEPKLWPSDPQSRSLARSAVAEMHSGFTALRQELPMNCRANQRKLECSEAAIKDIRRIEALWQQCQEQQSHSSSPSSSPSSSNASPWLFGEFGIIDAFFAPVALRFQGYQLQLQPHSRAYIGTQTHNAHLQQWIRDGQGEAEIIEEEEVGVTR
ncbi:MAG: glutathione S-transferase family protein [Motiliproteus sp.]